MSEVFGALSTSASGLKVFRTWMDAISDNVSNLEDVRRTSEPAFQAKYVVAKARENGGADVAGIDLGSAEGIVVSDPSNPLADAQGMVRRPDIDMGEQMTELLMAQRGYQANLQVVDKVREAYQQALQIGK